MQKSKITTTSVAWISGNNWEWREFSHHTLPGRQTWAPKQGSHSPIWLPGQSAFSPVAHTVRLWIIHHHWLGSCCLQGRL